MKRTVPLSEEDIFRSVMRVWDRVDRVLARQRAAELEVIRARVAEVGYRARVYDAPPLTFDEQFRRLKIENDRLNREVADLKRQPAQEIALERARNDSKRF